MMPPIKTLPIVERWDCAGCARCCRGSLVWLDDNDLRRLREQGWEKHPDFAKHSPVTREGWFGGRQRLTQLADGRCVFLLPDGRCRIHAELGAEAKPLMCRMYPLQLVPWNQHAYLTLRRSCPTAAADEGRPLRDHRQPAVELAEKGGWVKPVTRPPALTRRDHRSWDDATAVVDSLERLVSDERFPLVRRLVHGLQFCSLLEECRIRRLDSARLRELLEVLETNALDVGDLFQERLPPSGPARILFRQAAAEYVRLHPTYRPGTTWRERWRLARAAVAMARGRGELPRLHPDLPATTFESLERPLGHLSEPLQRPFLQFIQTQIGSRQFAVASRPGWSLVESFRALALAYPIGLWLLRWCSTDAALEPSTAVDIVTMLDRGQGYAPLTSSQHRTRVATLARLGELERLSIWYAR